MSAANSDNVDEKLLGSLRLALAGQPLPLQTVGKTPGIFPSGAAGKKLATEARNRDLVRECETPVVTGKKARKPKPLFSITPQGRQFVFDHDNPKKALESLQVAIRDVAGELRRPDSQSPGSNDAFEQLPSLFARHLEEIQDVLQRAAEASRIATQSREKRFADLGQLMGAVERVVERACQQPASPVHQPAPHVHQNSGSDSSWIEEIDTYLHSRRERNTPGDCPLPELYDVLSKRYPSLTIGAYHDALRRLHEANRIRLSGWSGPLENLPRPNLAMLVAHKVMYYARLP